MRRKKWVFYSKEYSFHWWHGKRKRLVEGIQFFLSDLRFIASQNTRIAFGRTTRGQNNKCLALTTSSCKQYSVLSDQRYTTGTALAFSTVAVLSNSKASLVPLKDICGLWSDIPTDVLMSLVQRTDCLIQRIRLSLHCLFCIWFAERSAPAVATVWTSLNWYKFCLGFHSWLLGFHPWL